MNLIVCLINENKTRVVNLIACLINDNKTRVVFVCVPERSVIQSKCKYQYIYK